MLRIKLNFQNMSLEQKLNYLDSIQGFVQDWLGHDAQGQELRDDFGRPMKFTINEEFKMMGKIA